MVSSEDLKTKIGEHVYSGQNIPDMDAGLYWLKPKRMVVEKALGKNL